MGAEQNITRGSDSFAGASLLGTEGVRGENSRMRMGKRLEQAKWVTLRRVHQRG